LPGILFNMVTISKRGFYAKGAEKASERLLVGVIGCPSEFGEIFSFDEFCPSVRKYDETALALVVFS